MVANRRAGGGSMMGAAAFNDPSSLSLSLSRSLAMRGVSVYAGVRALVGAFFYANDAGWCHRGAPGRPGQQQPTQGERAISILAAGRHQRAAAGVSVRDIFVVGLAPCLACVGFGLDLSLPCVLLLCVLRLGTEEESRRGGERRARLGGGRAGRGRAAVINLIEWRLRSRTPP